MHVVVWPQIHQKENGNKMKNKKQELTTAISNACADARAVAKRKNCKDGANVNGKFFWWL